MYSLGVIILCRVVQCSAMYCSVVYCNVGQCSVVWNSVGQGRVVLSTGIKFCHRINNI